VFTENCEIKKEETSRQKSRNEIPLKQSKQSVRHKDSWVENKIAELKETASWIETKPSG
jgi:hypothetical protein